MKVLRWVVAIVGIFLLLVAYSVMNAKKVFVEFGALGAGVVGATMAAGGVYLFKWAKRGSVRQAGTSVKDEEQRADVRKRLDGAVDQLKEDLTLTSESNHEFVRWTLISFWALCWPAFIAWIRDELIPLLKLGVWDSGMVNGVSIAALCFIALGAAEVYLFKWAKPKKKSGDDGGKGYKMALDFAERCIRLLLWGVIVIGGGSMLLTAFLK